MWKLLSACLALALAGCGTRHESGAVLPDQASFRLAFGVSGTAPVDWSGTVETSGGRVAAMAPWRFQEDDSLDLQTGRFQCQTRPGPSGEVVPHGFYVTVASAREVTVRTAQGRFSFRPGDVAFGSPLPVLEGRVEVERVPAALNLTAADQREDGFPAIAFDADGNAWVAWIAYRDRKEELVVAQLASQERFVVAEGEFWSPSLTTGADGRLHLAVSVRDGEDWRIATASGQGKEWTPLTPLSAGPRDVSPRIATDTHGHLWVVWQGYRDGSSRILASRNEGLEWGPELLVSGETTGAGEPALATDSKGRVHFTWDSYSPESTGIYHRVADDGTLAPVRRLASSGRHPAVMCDRSDRPWIVWDEEAPEGTHRLLKASTLAGDTQLMPPMSQAPFQQPELTTDERGNVWCLARRPALSLGGEEAWEYAVFPYTESPGSAIALPFSLGRNERRATVAAAPSGRLTVVWNGDGRTFARPTRPVKNEIYAAHIPGIPYGEPALQAQAAAKRTAPDPAAKEAAQARDWRIPYRGGELQLARGAVRELPAGPPSLRDHLQESRDTQQFSFLALVTLEQNPYQEWLAGKLSRIAEIPGRFAVLWGRPNDRHMLLWNELQPVWKPSREAAGTDEEQLRAHLESTGGVMLPFLRGKAEPDPDAGQVVLAVLDGPSPDSLAAAGVVAWTPARRTFLLVPELNPEAILEGLRACHAYTAAGNVLIDFRLGDAVPGDAMDAFAPITIRIGGSEAVIKAEILRDGKPVHTFRPRGASDETTFSDRSAHGQPHWYSVRVEQADGGRAYTCPIRVTGR